MAALIGPDDETILLSCTPALIHAHVPIRRDVHIQIDRRDLRIRMQTVREMPVELLKEMPICGSGHMRDPWTHSEYFEEDAVMLALVMHALDPDNPLDFISKDEFVCNVCGSRDNLQLCTRCKSELYCSRACQRQDWRRHKPECLPILFQN